MAEKEKKSGGLMGKFLRKDKDRPVSNVDSTYGSEGSRSSYNSAADSDQPQQHLAPNQVINDQGQVVTTTTTTTTTTTSTGSSSTANSSTNGPHNSSLVNKLDPRVNDNASGTSSNDEMSSSGAPTIPNRSNMRDRSPQPLQTGRSSNAGPTPSSTQDPYLNSSSPNSRQNFSYPDRRQTGAAGGGGQGTLQGLKTAAVGIHGAGETLRGTFNSAVDKRFHDPEAVARNQAIADSGRQEIESGKLSQASRAQGGIGSAPVKGILRKREGDGNLRPVNE
ncbi:uncharacterized protein KY384_007145 [Bacidia gigantensis]|uniref:uncharacterized protein n=1 Tax=Bacidia gigantensis TaxID=2732470 RepID=UPI001D04C15F|nr:uncharacterized protein KY384_007145 [Bacidia gigantensis]KAG8528228.1 hypothetical protein KY384_007145 [Bacidia gigantensis]